MERPGYLILIPASDQSPDGDNVLRAFLDQLKSELDDCRHRFTGTGTLTARFVLPGAGEILVVAADKVLSRAADGPRQTVEQLAFAATVALEKAGGGWPQVVCVGLDTPGPATIDGVLGHSPNLIHAEWDDFPVRAA